MHNRGVCGERRYIRIVSICLCKLSLLRNVSPSALPPEMLGLGLFFDPSVGLQLLVEA